MTEEPPAVNLMNYKERREDYLDPEYSDDFAHPEISEGSAVEINIDFSKPFKEQSILDRFDDIDDECVIKESLLEEKVKAELFEFKFAA